MEESALLRLDADGRLDSSERLPQHLVKESPRRNRSIVNFNFARSLGSLHAAQSCVTVHNCLAPPGCFSERYDRRARRR